MKAKFLSLNNDHTMADGRDLNSAGFGLFSFLWATAILFHESKLAIVARPPEQFLHMALVLAAIGVLIRPLSPVRFLVLAGVQLACAWADQPAYINHWLFVGLVHLSLFIALAGRLLMRHAGKLKPDSFFNLFIPILRVEVILLYLFAAISKFNTGFVDPNSSCAAVVYLKWSERIPFLPQGQTVLVTAIWGIILIELLVPALLIFRRSRVAGVILAWCLHLLLGINGHYGFSAIMMALLILFLPKEFPAWLKDVPLELRWIDERMRRILATAAIWAVPVTLCLGLAITLAAVTFNLDGTFPVWPWLRWGAIRMWLAAGLVFGGLICWFSLKTQLKSWPQRFFRISVPIGILGPALVFVNGLCPYLGLKTENTFTMYSNLRTESDKWNHFLVPQAVQVFSLQDHLVTIVDASDPRLRRRAEQNVRMTWHHFYSHVRRNPEGSVVYEYQGRRYISPLIGDDPLLSRELPVILKKLSVWRVVPTYGANDCCH